MDTRLLSLWSNFVAHTFARWGKCVGVFCVFFVLVKAEDGKAQPFAEGDLVWNESAQTLNAQTTFIFPLSAAHSSGERQPFEFWLLPNQGLTPGPYMYQFSREHREFRAADAVSEWPWSESGLGSLTVGGVEAAAHPGQCPSPQPARVVVPAGLKFVPVGYELRDNERILGVKSNHLPAGLVEEHQKGCLFLRVKSSFHPRLGTGNFAKHPEGGGSFSGPVFPVWRSEPLPMRFSIRWTGSQNRGACAVCENVDHENTRADFFALPPTLHFGAPALARVTSFVNLTTTKADFRDSNDAAVSELRATIEIFRAFVQQALDADVSSRQNNWRLDVVMGLPIEQLIVEQPNEIQLHPAFGSVAPPLGHYHRAALFRVLSRSFARHALSRGTTARTWEQLRTHETIARVLSEIWLQEAFPKVSFLREIAERFSFVPFFRAVQQGTAFLNNDVFVGREERASKLDYSTIEDFFSPLRGSELVERIDACLSENERKTLRKRAMDVATSRSTATEFADFLSSKVLQSECDVPMEQGAVPAWTFLEDIELNESGLNSIRLSRNVIEQSPSNAFFFQPQNQKRDTLNIEFSVNAEASGFEESKPAGMQEMFKEFRSAGTTVRVLAPHRAINSDRLQYPRPLRTTLQALAVSYDSRKSDVTVKSQIQTSQIGDEWSRSLTLGWRRELKTNHIDTQISTNIPSFLLGARSGISISSTSKLQNALPSFLGVSYFLEQGRGSSLYPDGAGLRIYLRRPLTLSALQEKMLDPEQEWVFTAAIPLAPRLTWTETLSYARSDSGVDAGLRSVPGWPAGSYVSQEYAVIRSEVRNILRQNLNVSLARSILFQHVVFYAAHVVAVDDMQTLRRGVVDARSAQSLGAGFRLSGSLFGAKDQAIAFEVARALSKPARTSFGFSIGRVTQ